MNTRQDFTDLKMKADSLAEFLRVLHSASLDKFSTLNQRYFEFKNIIDEPDTGGMKRANIINKFYETLVVAGGNELFENSANKITLQINTISLFYNSSIISIINSSLQILLAEKVYLDGLSPNSKENYLLQDIDITFSTISKLLVGIQSTLNDGYNLFNEVRNITFDYLNPYPSTQDPIYPTIIGFRKDVGFWIWDKIQYEVRDLYKMILGAMVEGEQIDTQVLEDTTIFETTSAQYAEDIAEKINLISMLENDIQLAQSAISQLENNNNVISSKNSEISSYEGLILELQSLLTSIESEIATLDPNSFESEAAYLTRLDELNSDLTLKNDQISSYTVYKQGLESEVSELISSNEELEVIASTLDAKQTELPIRQNELTVLQEELSNKGTLHSLNIGRLQRKKDGLPLESSPYGKGGTLRGDILYRISELDNYARDMFNYFGWIGAGNSLETIVPTSPGMGFASNSIATDYGYAMALNHFGKSVLCFKFNDNSDTDFTSLLPSSTVFIQKHINVNQYKLNMFMAKDQLVSGYDIATAITEKYRIEKEIEMLDVRRSEVVNEIDMVNARIESYSNLIQENWAIEEEKQNQRNVINENIQTSIELITSLNLLIQEKEDALSANQNKLQNTIAYMESLDPSSEGYAAELAKTQEEISNYQTIISADTAELATFNESKLTEMENQNSLNDQLSAILLEIETLHEMIELDTTKKEVELSKKNKLDNWMSQYDVDMANLMNSPHLDSHWGILNNANIIGEDVKLYTSNKIDSERLIESIIEEVKQVKLTTNVLN